jgi:arylsulfatase A
MRMGKWKLQFPHTFRNSKITPANDGHAGQYVMQKCDLELYDLATDIAESKNVADQHPEIVAKMQALANKKRAELGDRLRKIKGSKNREPGTAAIADWAKSKPKNK